MTEQSHKSLKTLYTTRHYSSMMYFTGLVSVLVSIHPERPQVFSLSPQRSFPISSNALMLEDTSATFGRNWSAVEICQGFRTCTAGGRRAGGYRDRPFVAAVSEMCFHSLFATRGDSSLHHSAVCYFLWSRSWPKGRYVLLFSYSRPNASPINHFAGSLFAFACILAGACSCRCPHQYVCREMRGLLLSCEVSRAIVRGEWTRLNSWDSVWVFISGNLNSPS